MRYKPEHIGAITGKLWSYLTDNPRSSLRKITRETNIQKIDVLLALGWLFKEDKVISEETKREIYFSLR